ncbi:MAG: hypothetical protein HC828_13825 [Blastochloris sp.]|nr:hypothetical protein [Blastochloris sp.]
MDTNSPLIAQLEKMAADVLRFVPGFVVACIVFLVIYALSSRIRDTIHMCCGGRVARRAPAWYLGGWRAG